VESQNFLGIYLRKDTASVLSVGINEGKQSIAAAFCVSIEKQKEQNILALINLIGEQVAEKEIQYSEVAVALDCSMFMQHKIKSDFNDPKQIAQTIRFDTEETLARDVSDISIAFKINSSNEMGSELTVFTAKKDLLADIIAALQSNKMDPITIEPDVHCLQRFLSQHLDVTEKVLVAMLSNYNAYIMAIGSSEHIEQTPTRTFLLGLKKDRTQVLQREVPITIALLKSENIDKLKVYDSTNSLDIEQLKEGLFIQVEPVNLNEAIEADRAIFSKDEDQVGFALAYGAALSLSKETQTIDFRSEFLPYQGKKLKFQKALKILSVSLTILIIAVGVYLQVIWFNKNKPLKELNNKFETQYASIMGKSPSKGANLVNVLKREIIRIKSEKSGQLGGMGTESLSARLARILLAFNKCAAQTNLNIDNINITTKTITIAGSTSSRRNTLKLRKSLEDNNLKIAKDSLEEKGGRDNFRITIEIKK
jgi:hypothetical protein